MTVTDALPAILIHTQFYTVSITEIPTPCPRKNCTPVYIAITLANNVGF